MRVIFVGIHNKPGMKPLDSKTKTGNIIDRIIGHLPEIDWIKSNLFEDEYFPKDKKEIWAGNLHWNRKYQPSSDTIIVLLGGWVHKNFLLTEAKIIKLAHPACFMYRSSISTENYITNAVEKIKSYLTTKD